MKYISKEYSQAQDKAVGASATATAVSQVFSITGPGRTNLIVRVKTSSVTSATGITFFVQSSMDGLTWRSTAKTTTISTNTYYYLTFNIEVSGDQADLPLMPIAQIVCTTGAGDAVTFDEIYVAQPI